MKMPLVFSLVQRPKDDAKLQQFLQISQNIFGTRGLRFSFSWQPMPQLFSFQALLLFHRELFFGSLCLVPAALTGICSIPMSSFAQE
jgi:hypothetical protein